jgi:hypothetical protein
MVEVGSNKKLKHPMIAKLWAKEKLCMDGWMRRRRQKVRNMFHVIYSLYGPNMKLIYPRIAKLWAK